MSHLCCVWTVEPQIATCSVCWTPRGWYSSYSSAKQFRVCDQYQPRSVAIPLQHCFLRSVWHSLIIPLYTGALQIRMLPQNITCQIVLLFQLCLLGLKRHHAMSIGITVIKNKTIHRHNDNVKISICQVRRSEQNVNCEPAELRTQRQHLFKF